MIRALGQFFDIRSVGLLPREIAEAENQNDASPGLEHSLVLQDYKPEISARRQAAERLQQWFEDFCAAEWSPDYLLVYNLSPAYNRFVHWLRDRKARPRTILLLADSSSLGAKASAWKRFRRRFKPLYVADETAMNWFDACIALSPGTRRFFEPRHIPWTWMPGGVTGSPLASAAVRQGPVSFGYFGALAAHAGILPLIDCFVAANTPGHLHICGYGKQEGQIRAMNHRRIHFIGKLQNNADCLRFGAGCDVLVNPRPLSHGNENNFPSKLFQYALTGRAILSSSISGTEQVLGPAAWYFDPRNFEAELKQQLIAISSVSREELDSRGRLIQERVLAEYAWPRQARQMAEFILRLPAQSR